jgi:hypothetical protein
MLYPQGSFYPQGAFSPPQGPFSPQTFQSNPFQNNPQGSFYPQGTFGPQGPFGAAGSAGPPAFANAPGPQAFANTPYGYPQQPSQQTSGFAHGLPQWSNWQQPAQQQAALQQHAMQQLLAHQLTAQQLAAQPQQPVLSNGATQPIGAWTQQPNAEQQINPRHQLLQQLAQYHYLVAQQLAQLAAQQAVQGSIAPFAGQFIPGQLGGSFAPGITMH